MEQEKDYEIPDKESGEDIEPINYFDYDFVKGTVKDLQGRMLTFVEAIVSDPEQRKGAKDTIRYIFNNRLNWIFEAAHLVEVDTNYPHSIIPIPRPIKKDGSIPKELRGIVLQPKKK